MTLETIGLGGAMGRARPRRSGPFTLERCKQNLTGGISRPPCLAVHLQERGAADPCLRDTSPFQADPAQAGSPSSTLR
jgi:hypothetical protein